MYIVTLSIRSYSLTYHCILHLELLLWGLKLEFAAFQFGRNAVVLLTLQWNEDDDSLLY
jgi:hypothetical protein